MSRMMKRLFVLAFLGLGIWLLRAALAADSPYKTKNVIFAVMDGVRYSETFGDPKRELIPNLAEMEKQGTLYTTCLDTGVTMTRQGHSTIATGTWQTVPLAGPCQTMPGVFEYARNELGWAKKDGWVIFGKGTYSYASYSSFPGYGKFCEPSFTIAIGENDISDDAKVLDQALKVMDSDKPRLMFVNFGVTDHIAHTNNWDLYREAIRRCDDAFGKIWQKVQTMPEYKDQTTFIFTNDHGRHDDKKDQLHDGFASHGDACSGCQHIMLLILGPDIKRGVVIDRKVLQVDIAPTVGELLGFQTPLAEGSVLEDCFVSFAGVNKKEAKTAEARRALEMKKLSERDLLKTIADANLDRDPASLQPSPETEILLRGMLAAAEASQDVRYRAFVEKWAQAHEKEGAEDPHVARILIELAAKGVNAESYTALAKACAEKCAAQAPAQTESFADALRIGLIATVAQVAKDQKLMDAAKTALGLNGKTEQDLIQAWQKLGIKAPPMACDFGPKPKALPASTLVDAGRFLALADAAAAMPKDRVIRLACDLKQSDCSRGVPEIGALWDDPSVSALDLYQVLALRKFRNAFPIKWVEIKQTKGKGPRKLMGPLWAFPEQCYKGAFPYAFNVLKFKVDEKGHYADGSALNDGAALLLFAAAKGTRMPAELGPQWVRWQPQLVPIPKGCTRVVIEFGGGKARTWEGTMSVEKGKLVNLLPGIFEDEDVLDETKRTFKCTTSGGTDQLVLDVQGGPDTTIVMSCKPQDVTFTLGDLQEKKTIENRFEDKNFLKVTTAKE